MRLIDADALLKAMKQTLNENNPSHAHIFDLITNAPTIEKASIAKSDKRIAELKSHINVLREALEDVKAISPKTQFYVYISQLCEQALASTPAQSSANIDIYNSVSFADDNLGTMIMDSRIVKWLIKNKAQNYFDELSKGKL